MIAPSFGIAGLIAAAALGVAAVAVLAIHVGLLPPLAGFGVAMVAWLGGGATALLLALLSLRSTSPAWLGLVLAVVLLAPVVGPARALVSAPRIHDISTDLQAPPPFTAAAADPANAGRDLTYPEGDPDSGALQRRYYPDIASENVAMQPSEALAAALNVAGELGWQVGWRDDAGGTFEATATSGVFRFVDDVVVRVLPAGSGSRVDVRSTSRVGRSDLGANAARIRRFLAALRRQTASG